MQPLDLTETQKRSQLLLTEISTLKLLGQSKMSPEVSTLRTIVLDAHADAEEVLFKIISKHLFNIAYDRKLGNLYKNSYPKFLSSLSTGFFRNTSLVKLMNSALDLKIIDDFTWDQLRLLNNMRVCLAHPRDLRWKQYQKDEPYCTALQLVVDVTRNLASIDVKYGFKGL